MAGSPGENCSTNFIRLLAHLIFLFILFDLKRQNQWAGMPLRVVSMQVFFENEDFTRCLVPLFGLNLENHLLQCLVWMKTCRLSLLRGMTDLWFRQQQTSKCVLWLRCFPFLISVTTHKCMHINTEQFLLCMHTIPNTLN